eukprot:365228-Chlamydomonas_euryale.AAC.3
MSSWSASSSQNHGSSMLPILHTDFGSAAIQHRQATSEPALLLPKCPQRADGQRAHLIWP